MTIPAHKQTDPDKKPGQIVNPINTDMMDEMSGYAVTPEVKKLGEDYRINFCPSVAHMHRTGQTIDQTQTPAVTAANYKPAHGGYPTPAPYDWTLQTR